MKKKIYACITGKADAGECSSDTQWQWFPDTKPSNQTDLPILPT